MDSQKRFSNSENECFDVVAAMYQMRPHHPSRWHMRLRAATDHEQPVVGPASRAEEDEAPS